MIIGSGPGGLCLAQGLKRAGIPFTLFEREPALDARSAGYRLRIDAAGQEALSRCLPVDLLYLLYQSATLAEVEPLFIDPQARAVAMPAPESWAVADKGLPDLCVDRGTLLEILQCGIAGHIRFGHGLTGFDHRDDGIVARFANGEEASGAVLVGADGMGSAVRRQVFPDMVPRDVGHACIYGRAPASPANCRAIGRSLCAGTSVVFADGFSAIVDVMSFREPLPALAARISGDCRLSPVNDYFYWALTGPRERLGLAGDGDDPADLADRVWRLIGGWHPTLQALFLRGDPQDWMARSVHSLLPDRGAFPDRVALLGDAIHVMSPAGGLGASTALQDSADLASRLAQARSPAQQVAALRLYGESMRRRAMAAVELSLEGSERLAAPIAA